MTMIRSFAVLALVFTVALAQTNILANPEFEGCQGTGTKAFGWLAGVNSIPTTDYPSTNLPAGDQCYTSFFSRSGVIPVEQNLSDLSLIKTYTFSALVACHLEEGSGTCNFKFTVNGVPINGEGVTIAATTPMTFQLITFSGYMFTSTSAKVGLLDTEVRPPNVEGGYGIATRISLTGSTAGGSGDPHFLGFNGQVFDFIGHPHTVYNVLSDPSLQVNVELGLQQQSEKTTTSGPIMQKMSLSTAAHTVLVNCGGNKYEEVGSVSIDGQVLAHGQKVTVDGLTVSFTALNANAQEFGLLGNDHVVGSAQITLADKYDFIVYFIENGRSLENPDKWILRFPHRFLDFNAQLLDSSLTPHGILGQTAHMDKARSVGEWTMEGTDKDYEVRDGLFGSKFTFNQFQ